MFSQESRCIYGKNQLIEVICQLRFPDILKIEAKEPFEFQETIRADYPQYQKKVEQLPPKQENGKLTPQGTANNYQFISADGQWKVSLSRGFIALSTHAYSRWEAFANRLDRILAAFIKVYEPAFFSRVGLRYINAFRRAALGLDGTPWRELIQPGYLGLMGDDDAQEGAFLKNEQNITAAMPGGAKCNIKCGPGMLRKINNQTRQSQEEKVFMLDIDLFMEGNTPMNHAVPALNVVHGNAGSLFRGAITDTLHDAMEPRDA